MNQYKEKLDIVKTVLTDTARIKADSCALRQTTGYNALLLVADLPDGKAYNALFGALKRDCKEAGYKFAGTPLHKSCNVVKSIKFDFTECWKKIGENADSRTEGTPEERLFWAFQEFLKSKCLTFSATQGKIAKTLAPTKTTEREIESIDSIEDDELQAVLIYIRTCGKDEFDKIVNEVTKRGEKRAEKKS